MTVWLLVVEEGLPFSGVFDPQTHGKGMQRGKGSSPYLLANRIFTKKQNKKPFDPRLFYDFK